MSKKNREIVDAARQEKTLSGLKAVTEAVPGIMKDAIKEEITSEKPVKVKKKREPKEKVVKIMYPGLKMDANGDATVKLEAWPADFDPAKHARLKRSNFTTEIPFLEKRAERLEKKAADIRKEIEAIRAGKPESGKAMKKMLKMADQFSSLMGELAGELSPEQMEEFKKMFAGAGATSADAK